MPSKARSCNGKSVEDFFSNQLSVQIKTMFMFTLTVTSLAPVVLCNDIYATTQMSYK